ncbi:MAG: hypothetical protein ACRC7N_10590 [Clostridium sp.]
MILERILANLNLDPDILTEDEKGRIVKIVLTIMRYYYVKDNIMQIDIYQWSDKVNYYLVEVIKLKLKQRGVII